MGNVGKRENTGITIQAGLATRSKPHILRIARHDL
jgi:hypothetical protein